MNSKKVLCKKKSLQNKVKVSCLRKILPHAIITFTGTSWPTRNKFFWKSYLSGSKELRFHDLDGQRVLESLLRQNRGRRNQGTLPCLMKKLQTQKVYLKVTTTFTFLFSWILCEFWFLSFTSLSPEILSFQKKLSSHYYILITEKVGIIPLH